MSGNYRGSTASLGADPSNIDGDKGDITVSNSGASWTIDPNVVTYSKLQQASTTDVLLGRASPGVGNFEEIPLTSAGRALLGDITAADQRATLGLTSTATAVIGTDVLAFDSNLQDFVNTFTLPTDVGTNGQIVTTDGAGSLILTTPGGLPDGNYGDITVSAGNTIWNINSGVVGTTELANSAVTYTKLQNVSNADLILGRSTAGAGVVEEIICTAAGRALLDDASASDQRTTLGLGTIATQNSATVSITGGTITGITDLAIADGGTGASTAAAAFTNLKQAASETATGVVELLTAAEYQTGTDTTRALTAAVARNNNIVAGPLTSTNTGAASYLITGIPTWGRKITIVGNDTSTNSTSNFLVQIGDAGGIETTLYDSAGGQFGATNSADSVAFTTGFGLMSSVGAATDFTWTMTLWLQDPATNTWIMSSSGGSGISIRLSFGSKSLSAPLDRFQLTTVGGVNTFDGGNFKYFVE